MLLTNAMRLQNWSHIETPWHKREKEIKTEEGERKEERETEKMTDRQATRDREKD